MSRGCELEFHWWPALLEIFLIVDFYASKKGNFNNTTTNQAIIAQVAAEATLSVWRELPHIAKFKKKRLFDTPYYPLIFDKLNAAQLIIAVLIFRFTDEQRRSKRLLDTIKHLPYSNYHIAMLLGKIVLADNKIALENLNHTNFSAIKTYFEMNKIALFDRANKQILQTIAEHFHRETIEHEDLALAFYNDEFSLQLLPDYGIVIKK